MGSPPDNTGLVVLCGAGPGRADLLTRRAARWLGRADVVVHDRLVGADMLDLARPDAERIDVGKSPGGPRRAQERIHELLIDRARAGQLVVRLKGGDPFIFGRGGEEAEALAAAGVPYRVVCGVTAALAAAAEAAIPLTDRRRAASVALVTARESPDKPEPTADWGALARVDTLVIYMPVAALEEVARRLMSAGRAGATPAAVVERAGTAASRTLTATLETVAARARAAKVSAPAVVIVGPTVALRDRLRAPPAPLEGRTVLVTRPRGQAAELADLLDEAGARALLAPAVEIVPPQSYATLDAALARAWTFDWVAFTSVNAVAAVFDRLAAAGGDARRLSPASVATIGAATERALADRGIRADLLADPHTTAALGDALIRSGVDGAAVLLPRADVAPCGLEQRLRSAGASVERVTAYRTVRPASLPAAARDALGGGRVDWVTFTSRSCVENFLALAQQGGASLSGVGRAAIGPVTAAALAEHGLDADVVAEEHTVAGLVRAMVAAAGG